MSRSLKCALPVVNCSDMGVSMKEKLESLLQTLQPYDEFDYETDLFETGILNSVDFVLFITMIEEEFDIRIPEERIDSEQFSTLLNIENFLKTLG